MGNHVAGQAIEKAATILVARRKPGETALALLDQACKGHHNTDAEFESTDPDELSQVHPEYANSTDPHPKAPLGMLLLEAFAPNGVADQARYAPMLGSEDPDDDGEAEDAAYELWRTEVYEPFKARYGFC